ncbi:hypothetical protein JW826_03465 [Candidatus Woesearchaeota archaeon]|nr:hypothetical protein [Candidatus Woesearchaeota archaeon]
MERIKTGIHGLDDLIGGGMIKGSNVLVFGRAGSGKTLLALEYLYKGASVFGQPGLFVSFDQSEEELLSQCERMGWDMKKYVKKGMIKILCMKIEDIGRDFVIDVFEAAGKVKAERMVIDNLTLLTLSPFFMADNKKFNIVYKDKVRVANTPIQLIYNMISILKDIPTTNIYLTVPGTGQDVTNDGISEYVCDGVIHLDLRSIGKSFLRTLEVRKMRRSKVTGGIHGFKITDNGIRVEQ